MTPARGLCQHALVMTAQAPAQRSPRGHDDDTIVLTCHAQSLTHMSRTEAAVKGRSRTPSRRRYVNGGGSLAPRRCGYSELHRGRFYPWGCRSSCSLAFRVRTRRWLHDHITDLVTDIGPEGFADEAVLAGGTGAPSILGFSTRVSTTERRMHRDSGE